MELLSGVKITNWKTILPWNWRDGKGTGEKREATTLNAFLASTSTANAAGVSVTNESMWRIGAVSSSINVISQDLAKIPLHTFEQRAGIKQHAKAHRVFNLLYIRPNPDMTSYTFRYFLFRSVLARGNAFAQIRRDGEGKPFELWPIHPDRVIRIRRRASDGTLLYDIKTDDDMITLESNDVIHIKGDTNDGITGLSPIKANALTFGIALAQAEFGASYFANGANVDLAVTIPADIASAEDEVQKRYKSGIEQRHTGGPTASFRVLWLAPGGDIKPITPTLEAAQYIEGRRFSRTEIAGIYRLSPHKIGEYTEMKYATVEAMETAHVNDALMGWAAQFEQECNWKLFSESERGTYFVRFNFAGLLRGDAKSRAEYYHYAIQDGWMNRNEVRDLEERNPAEGLDEFLVPMNMGEAGNVGNDTGDGRAIRSDCGCGHEHRSGVQHEHRADDDDAKRRQEAAEKRIRIQQNMKRLIETEVERLVKRERQDIAGLVKKNLRDATSFKEAKEAYYAEFEGVVAERMLAPMLTLAESIREEAQAEVSYDGDITQEVGDFTKRYVDNYAKAHARSSKAQLDEVVDTAIEEGRDPGEAVQERLDEWGEKRASKTADRESVDLANAVAKYAWKLAGIRFLRWHTNGSENCPYCRSLNGRVVGIDSHFVSADSEVSVDGVAEAMKVSHNVGHAPLHFGCQCSISPSN